MDYEIDFMAYAHEIEKDDVFNYEGQTYRALCVFDDDQISILAECLTDMDDVTTLELEPNTKLEVLTLV